MAASATETPVFLIKKLGGLALVICGIIVAAFGYGDGSKGLALVGIGLAALGVILMALKIIRRNQGNQL
jgi:drug/metabolite transporter (DMT)-like permease